MLSLYDTWSLHRSESISLLIGAVVKEKVRKTLKVVLINYLLYNYKFLDSIASDKAACVDDVSTNKADLGFVVRMIEISTMISL